MHSTSEKYKGTSRYEHRGSYMSAHVLLNLLNELGKRDKMAGLSKLSLVAYAINTKVQHAGSFMYRYSIKCL